MTTPSTMATQHLNKNDNNNKSVFNNSYTPSDQEIVLEPPLPAPSAPLEDEVVLVQAELVNALPEPSAPLEEEIILVQAELVSPAAADPTTTHSPPPSGSTTATNANYVPPPLHVSPVQQEGPHSSRTYQARYPTTTKTTTTTRRRSSRPSSFRRSGGTRGQERVVHRRGSVGRSYSLYGTRSRPTRRNSNVSFVASAAHSSSYPRSKYYAPSYSQKSSISFAGLVGGTAGFLLWGPLGAVLGFVAASSAATRGVWWGAGRRYGN